MKKTTFNAPLNHKAYSYEPMQIEVEKVIPLYGKRFEQMRDHPLEDAPEIIENRELMYMKGNTAHCILFLDASGSDGILVEAEGADYARKSQFISNARAIIEQSEFTYGERQLHAELKAMAERIAELAHTGQKHFTFEEMLGDGNLKTMMIELDFRCENRFQNNFNILYGHNMKNGSMFANVCRFKDKSYYDSHPYGWVYTADSVYRLDFFSVAVTDWHDEIYNGYREVSEWIPRLKEISRIYENMELTEQDRLDRLTAKAEDIRNWLCVVREYMSGTVLDRELLHRLIKVIRVGETTVMNGQKQREVEIVYRF